MAQIEITVRRDNGTAITASGTVDDTYVADISMTLTALLFDTASATPVPAEPTPVASPAPTQEPSVATPPAPGRTRAQ
jgi:hypothetical protein